MLFHVPSTIGYSRKGVKVRDVDIQIALDVLGIDHHPVYQNKDMHDLLICYVHIHQIEPPRDPESGLNFYVQLLNLLANDGFTA